MHGYKQRQRQTNPEFVIGFSKNNGDYETIENAAKNHNLSITSFIRYASLAYVRRTFVVPDRFQVAKLEQLLFDCLNEIKTLVHKKERFFFDREQKIEVIEKRIARLEGQIGEAFRNPPLCIHDRQNKVS
jgi:hypothetical protein